MIFMAVVVLGLLSGGMAVGALIGYIDKLPRIDELDNYNPPGITRYFDRTGNTQIGEDFTEKRELVRLSDVPQHVQNAFLAIEDERFYQHFGVDLKGIARAINTNLQSGGKMQGASTITMQVARNIVLDDRKKNFTRKFKELLVALQMERFYSKEQILEFYLNHIFFGERAYGIQAAAKVYFNKDVKDLSIPEAAVLAGLPKAPSSLSPVRNKEKSRERRNLVLFNMRKLNFIKTDDEFQRYKNSPIELNQPSPPPGDAPYFVDYMRSILMKDNSIEHSSALGAKGYTIISTVDLELQRICEEELSKGLREVEKMIESQKEARYGVEASELGSVRKKQARLGRIKSVNEHTITVGLHGYNAEVPLPEKLPYFNPNAIVKPGNLIDIYIQDIKNGKLEAYLYDKTHVQGSAVLTDNKTGEILALVGGDDFNDPVNNGQWNRASQGGRQPGSCWKPLLYGASFDVNDDKGNPRFTPGYVEVDEPMSFPNGWSPKNYEDKHYGATSLYQALVKSRNIPTIKLFMDIGPKKGLSLYHKFNIVNRPSNWDLLAIPSMCLGTPNITPLELAGAYSVFAGGGHVYAPTAFKRFYSSKNPADSRIVKPEKYQVITPQAAYMTTRILQDAVMRGTGKATIGKWVEDERAKGRKIPDVAGKTGTTNDCFVAWFCGYTPDLTLTIYTGFDQHRTMGPKMTGGTTVGPIWVPMMDRILQTRDDWKLKFDVPADIQLVDICGVSGKRVAGGCDPVYTNAAFKKGTAPTGSCGYHGGGGYVGGGEEVGEAHYNVGRGTSIGEPGAPVAPAGAYGYGVPQQPQQPYGNYMQPRY